jgi:HAD superfamily phosphatase (TIGR01681 family)
VALALESPDSTLADFPVTRSGDDTSSICVAATFTAELLDSPLSFWTETLGLKHKVKFAPYNQVFQELLSPNSLFRQNALGVNVALIRLEDWWDENNENPVKDIRQKMDEFANALETFAAGSNIPVLVCFCPFSKRQQAKTDLDNAESELIVTLDGIGNVYPVISRDILSTVEVEEYDEPLGIEAGHVPYTDEFFASLSYTMARKIYSITGKPYKAIVLDCDQTLWKGVVGEDGPMNVYVDSARKALQELMIEKHHAGTLICLCSKNIEQDVFDVFDHNPQMVLKREHISFSKVNWSPKSQNLRELADEINIGLDSFIFIDDNPVECAQVRA